MSKKEFDPTKNTNLQTERVKQNMDEGKELLKRHNLQNLFWYDDANRGRYFHETAIGEWISDSAKEFEDHLAGYGLETTRPDGGKLAETKRIARHIKMYNRVDYVGRLAGHRAGFEVNNGKRVLVTHTAKIPEPNPNLEETCPTLLQFLDNMFGDYDGMKLGQLEHFLGWWRDALLALQNPDRGEQGENGLAIVLAGDVSCGKTLLTKIIRVSFGGRECKPFQFLLGNEKFNSLSLASELWLVDDEQSAIDQKTRSAFAASVKAVVADPKYRIRGMHRDDEVFSFFRRLVICTNREEERLQSLPSITSDIEDKISLFLCRKLPMPMPVNTTEEKKLFWNTLIEELPSFIYWVCNIFEPEDKTVIGGRFGVKHFHHPDLTRDLFETSKEQILWDHIKKTLFPSSEELSSWWWEGTATELRDMLIAEDSPLTKRERGYVPQPSRLGRELALIQKQFPELLKKHWVARREVWLLVQPDKTVFEFLELRKANAKFAANREVE